MAFVQPCSSYQTQCRGPYWTTLTIHLRLGVRVWIERILWAIPARLSADDIFLFACRAVRANFAYFQCTLFSLDALVTLLQLPFVRLQQSIVRADFSVACRTGFELVHAIFRHPNRIWYYLGYHVVAPALKAGRTLLTAVCIWIDDVLIVKTLMTPTLVVSAIHRLVARGAAYQVKYFVSEIRGGANPCTHYCLVRAPGCIGTWTGPHT